MFLQTKVNTSSLSGVLSSRFVLALTIISFAFFAYVLPASAETATVVDLGTAGNFAVLSKVQIDSTGATTIVGDIGVSPAAHTFLTGFSLIGDETSDTFLTSVQLPGYKAYSANLQPPTPSNMSTAIGDMELAYTAATGGANVAGVGAFLNIGTPPGTLTDLTLIPGVYTWGTSVVITGDVTLDCSADANAVFVFQIAGDLTLADSQQIILTNCDNSNIFWAVGGTTFLQGSSHFEGTLLAGPGVSEITVITGATVNGRLLGEKTISLQANTVITNPAAGTPVSDIAVVAQNFNTNTSTAYYGVTTGFALSGTMLGDITEAKVELYDVSNNLLVTNTFKDTFLPTLRAGGQFSSAFRVKIGTYTTSSSQNLGAWTPISAVKPAKMVVTVTDVNGGTHVVEEVILSESTATWEDLFIPNSIAITTPATKLSYEVGDALDISGLVVTGTYDDLTSIETINGIQVTGFDSSSAVTGQVITITVGGATATYSVTIVAESVQQSSGSGGRRKPATPAVPAVPHVSPAVSAIPSANANQMVSASAFTFVRELALEDTGADVTALQNRLTREGVYSGPITGYFGQLTEAGVKAYQAKMGISNTGNVGPQTMAALNNGERSQDGVAKQIATMKLQLIVLIQKLIVALQTELNAKVN